MNKIKAVIFDWAGTTVDYGCFAPVHAFVKVFQDAGIEPTMAEVREPMGMLKWDHIRTMLEMPRIKALWSEKYGEGPTDADADKLYEGFEPTLLGMLADYASPKPYVLETVKELRTKGIKIGSTTGYTDKMMKIVVEGAKQQGYAPECWFSPDAVGGKGRPHPDMVFKNMETLRVTDTSSIIKVGDTISDIKEGKSAGVFTIGVLEGSSQIGLNEDEYERLTGVEKKAVLEKAEAEYKEAGADAVIKDIREVLQYI